ncbi:hypothetical protein BB561_005952 [Smittium simulii]|uniref:Mitochondrial carrier protein n=1 Tax=Smittium simulii TaxID=133385 RepID=A0A2T9Y7E7_9FUNG|nr:hypothetical protein BB561_005952 [Smittium simulii]
MSYSNITVSPSNSSTDTSIPNTSSSSSASVSLSSKPLSGWHHSLAGGIGGLAGAIVTAPFDVIRTRLQSSQSVQFADISSKPSSPFSFLYRSRTLSVVRKTFITEGIAGFYLGLVPNLLGIIPSRAIQFASYTQTKKYLIAANSNVESSAIHVLSGISSGLITATLTNPIWVIKTRMQLGSYKNTLDCLIKTLKNESVKGLYNGITASYLGIIEISIQWALYEKFKSIAAKSDYARSNTSISSTWLSYLGSATASKLLASLIAYPHEVLRTRMRQMPMHYIDPITNTKHFGSKYSSLLRSCRFIYIEEGIRGFYGGLTPHLFKTVPNAAVMFVTFEFISDFMKS